MIAQKILPMIVGLFYGLRAHNKEYKSIIEPSIGGGNLLMAIGLFSALEYLSKIYYVLKIGIQNIHKNDKYKNDIKWRKPIVINNKRLPCRIGINKNGRRRA